jgi:hypothetical protein
MPAGQARAISGHFSGARKSDIQVLFDPPMIAILKSDMDIRFSPIRLIHMNSRLFILTFVLSAVLLVAPKLSAQQAEYDHAAINYTQSVPNNVVSRLQQRIDGGEATLTYDSQRGWLPAVLEQLGISPSSQTLVFSKTSLQRQRIAPRRPRALYFGDDAYVGYCQNGEVMEISAVDSQLGPVFYTLDQKAADKPQFVRQTENCLICHASPSHTSGVPGHLLRSLFCDTSGLPILSAGSHRIDQTSPIQPRWGGWSSCW